MKILSKKEFLGLNRRSAEKLYHDKKLQSDALQVLVNADRYRWLHQSSWMGEPLLNLPQDMFAIQEIVYKTRPDFIIETGVAWGGSLLFHASLLELIGGKYVVGIDVFLPRNLIDRLKKNKKLYKKIKLLQGSSTDPASIKKINAITGNSKKVLVILDSYHTHDHVLQELRLYSKMVGKGYFLICGDTIVEKIPKQAHRKRAWGPGNNPETALRKFLQENKQFKRDTSFDQKMLLTCHPGGYLKAVK
jgi:cephalosporin hydroxylase